MLAKSIIKKWWSKQASQSQERFEEVYAEGVFSADEAEDWADEIWGESDTEDWSPIELELAESSGCHSKKSGSGWNAIESLVGIVELKNLTAKLDSVLLSCYCIYCLINLLQGNELWETLILV